MLEETDFKNVVALTASISGIVQFLSGTLICLKIVHNKTTSDLSAFPFVSGCLSTSLWLRYGFLIHDSSIVLVNTVGAALFFAYTVTFLAYCIKKTPVLRQLLSCTFFLLFTLFYIQKIENHEDTQWTLGVICCLVTILFFAAPLASFLHVLRVKNTESLPFPIIFTSFLVAFQWLIYGILLGDKFIQIPNFLGCLLSGFQLTLFCLYPSKTTKGLSAHGELI